MARIRISTTVDPVVLADVRARRAGVNDATLIDEALRALRDRLAREELDRSYAAYDENPLDHPDEWGDLASFSDAARGA